LLHGKIKIRKKNNISFFIYQCVENKEDAQRKVFNTAKALAIDS